MTTDEKHPIDPNKSICCRAPLIAYRSYNIKVCADCGQKYDWHLKPGQEPLIKHQR